MFIFTLNVKNILEQMYYGFMDIIVLKFETTYELERFKFKFELKRYFYTYFFLESSSESLSKF